jgi:hypothetical protein
MIVVKCDLVRCAGVKEVFFVLKMNIALRGEPICIPLAVTDSEVEATSSRSAIDNILFAMANKRKQEVLRDMY